MPTKKSTARASKKPVSIKSVARKKSPAPPASRAARRQKKPKEELKRFRTPGVVDAIRVRMYCHGFGDCFLLSFMSSEQVVYRMLIDCGQLTGSTDTMIQAIENIRDECGGKLNLVVQTHEHKDHISGFNSRRKDKNLLWDDIEVDTIWLAWTEKVGKDGDPLAIDLKKKQEMKKKALAKAVALYNQHIEKEQTKDLLQKQYLGADYYAAQQRYSAALQQILGFFDISEKDVANTLSARGDDTLGLTMKEAMNYFKVRNKATGKPEIFFWDPGDLADDSVTGVQGVNFYFLGPPKDYKKLQVMEDKKHVEMYMAEMGLAENFYIPLTESKTDASDFSPFSNKYFLTEPVLSPDEKKDPLHVWNLYHSRDYKWRKIEVDWLHNAGALALHLDSYTNNTSLVIAIEFGPDNKVLLFPADAQIGNWLSWTEPKSKTDKSPAIRFELKKNGKKESRTAVDLLENTVLYKVGHHASHNATAKKHGLELMSHRDLVAIIPVDEEVAKKQGKKGWKMPAEDLYERLKQKTKGRIIRADKGNILESRTENVPATVRCSKVEQNEFSKKISYSDTKITTDDGRTRPLYVEYTVEA